jgi:hypothetical protein
MAVANSTSITWKEVIVAVHGSNIAMKNSQIQTFTVATWSMNSNNSQIQKFPDTNIYSTNLEHDYYC